MLVLYLSGLVWYIPSPSPFPLCQYNLTTIATDPHKKTEKGKGYIPTPFSLIMFCALVFAADVMAGEEDAAAKEPKRRVNMDAMVDNWFNEAGC